jgi:ATP-dependent helicase HrpA
MAAIRAHPVLIVAGETGSGKTTQLPKMCLAAGRADAGQIACTQPRRVAALAIARRLAEELRTPPGGLVGAKIRFTDQTGPDTLVKVLTDGMLLAEVHGDPRLRAYGTVIVDEAHERSLNIDFLLGHLHNLLQRRRDLRVVITSATINTEAFAKAFGGAPVIEVSGRMYPVETVYAPIDEVLEDTGEFTYIEAVARAVGEIAAGNSPGDILVFLPGERDIREARDLLQRRDLGRAEILPLFGRLGNADQQRIFAASRARKIILATNIAETSLTIPGIRFVVDSGLARVSRYSPQTHTQRLPIEKIARSSAEQRQGRAGRVEAGRCIRLYAERDLLARPPYPTPEILRANLAAVILRMLAFGLGDIETFPFLDPPGPRAINAGYQQLQNLGALDDQRHLTPLGRRLARLPCDPTIGRMLLQAAHEGAMREVLVIGAALGIQDPRERPAEARAEADQMHRRFVHPESDFLTLLNIWNATHDATERLSQAQLRKFCKAHFLSYQRMREWRDVHLQLGEILDETGDLRLNRAPAEYHQVHRALLAGLLSHVARREDGNHYRATHDRKAMLFPGSTLYRREPRKAPKGATPAQVAVGVTASAVLRPPTKGAMPPWIMCAEWMETSRLYARCTARIDPAWILDLGRHLLKHSFSEPRYDEKGERVLARETIRLFGLEVTVRQTGYLRVKPAEATEIFIREALVADRLGTTFPFLEHNRAIRHQVENLQTRIRSFQAWTLDERLYRFYAARLQDVGSAHDLRRRIRDRWQGADHALRLTEADLIDPAAAETDATAYPETVAIAGVRLLVDYAYRPGAEDDGATLKVPVGELAVLDRARLDWLVPGYLRERIEALLRGLPKELRRQLQPLAPKAVALAERAREAAKAANPTGAALTSVLERLLAEDYGVVVRPGDWDLAAVPAHLRPRVEIVDDSNQAVAAGRDPEAVRQAFAAVVQARSQDAAAGAGTDAVARIWQAARAAHERPALQGWSLPDYPAELVLGTVDGVPVPAWPGLRVEDGCVALRLFESATAAAVATPAAFHRLCLAQRARAAAWLERDLQRESGRIRLAASSLLAPPQLEADLYAMLQRHALACPQPLPLRQATFAATLAQFDARTSGSVPRCVDLLADILARYHELLARTPERSDFRTCLDRLVHPEFLRTIAYQRLQHYPRYLRALALRIERAARDPRRDGQRAALVTPWQQACDRLPAGHPNRRALRWLIEEYRVQIFAQELGTAEKVSPARINKMMTND